MRVYRGFDAYPARPAPAAAAIGNFDGLHPGHVKILDRLKSVAGQGSRRSLVLTFDPHPARVFGHRKNFRLIQTLPQRLEGLKSLGIEAVLIVPFESSLPDLSPKEFVDDILIRRLRARAVVVGRGFRFGRGRTGGAADLTRNARGSGADVVVVPPVIRQGRIVSSTIIRDALGYGQVARAAVWLGRPYEIAGRVVRGCGRGSGLGFPTANILSDNEILPKGVFVSQVLAGRRTLPAMTSIGTCPTFGGAALSIETHLFGFSGNLYETSLRIRLLEKIRSQRTFPNAEALRKRLDRDRKEALQFFRRLDIRTE